jgi:hypothetical protein
MQKTIAQKSGNSHQRRGLSGGGGACSVNSGAPRITMILTIAASL